MAPLKFGDDFELDLSAYELRRAGRVVKLERIPMQILIFLMQRRPDLVTHEQITEKIWGQGVFVDTENSIRGAIRKIRKALRDDAEKPRFIRTVTGMGYRFIAPLDSQETVQKTVALPAPAGSATAYPQAGPEPPAPASPISTVDHPVEAANPPLVRTTIPDVEPNSAGVSRRFGRRWAVLLVAALLVGVAGGLYLYRSSSSAAPSSPDERLMLAVLPFVNLTGDSGQDYFSDGFTEEMITRLGSVAPGRLGIIARTSVMYYKQARVPLDRLSRDLGVQYVLEGSVRRDSQRVRITAQLIKVKDQTHLWARQYDREQTDVLRVQEEIAHAIAEQIELTLRESRATASQAPALSPRDYEAYDVYLKGRYFWNQRTREGFEKAIASFLEAIEKSPGEARAYAGLADSYALMGTYNHTPQEEAFPKAREAALKALEMDPSLAAAHTSLALINQHYDWDWQTSGDRFRRAIELDPNYATGHHWYAEYLAHLGRFDEALGEMERARQLDPRSLIIAADRGVFLYFARRYDQSIDQFRAVLAVNPAFPRANLIIAAYAQQTRFADAMARLREWERLDDGPWPRALAAYLYGRQGKQREAQKALRELEKSDRSQMSDLLWPTIVAHVGMGLKEQAFAGLQEACRTHSSFLVALKVDPFFDPLRDDPRFQDLLRCVGLPP